MVLDPNFATSVELVRFVQEGNSVDFLNDTGSDILAGTPLQYGAIVGVSKRLIPDGEVGTLAINKAPQFEAPIAVDGGDNYTYGQEVWWDETNEVVVPQGDGNATFKLGYAISGAGGHGLPTVQHAPGVTQATGAAAAGDTLIRFVLAG